MSERSPYHSPSRFLLESPARYNYIGVRQPLYLQPNSPFMSPRGSRMSSPRHSSCGSPDFIPLGISSPVIRSKHGRKSHNYSNNSYSSYSNSPQSSNSSFNNSPYKKPNARGNFRGRGNFNNSGISSAPISHYAHEDMLRNPWAELEAKDKDVTYHVNNKHISDSEETQDSAVGLHLDSSSAISDSDNL